MDLDETECRGASERVDRGRGWQQGYSDTRCIYYRGDNIYKGGQDSQEVTRGVSNSLVRHVMKDETGKMNRPATSMETQSGDGKASGMEVDCLRIWVTRGNTCGTDSGGIHLKEEHDDR